MSEREFNPLYRRGLDLTDLPTSFDSDDISEGSTNLYSQFEHITSNSKEYIIPKVDTDALIVGKSPHSSVTTGTFGTATAFFNDNPTAPGQGTAYFATLAYGVSGIPLGGAYVAGHARGTYSSPTQTLGGTFLGGYLFAGYSGTAWEVNNGTHVAAGLYAQANSDVTTSDVDMDIYLGGLITKMITFETGTNAIKFNEAMLDSDITFYWDSGSSLSQDGATGDWTFDNDVQIDGTLTVGTAPTYSASNVSTDRTYDANSTSLNELADVLGTLIADLQTIGLLQ